MRYLKRRSMLQLAGGASLLPFLPYGARAQDLAAPKRLLVVFSPMGYLESSFFPTGSSTDFTLGDTMTALEDYKSQLIYLDGMINYGAEWFFSDDDNEHGSGMAMAFTASQKEDYATGPSIDQVVAEHLAAQNPTSFKSIALGVNAPAPSGRTSCFLSGSQKPVNPQNSPVAAFEALFKDFQPQMGQDGSAVERRRKQKQSVIDLVRSELNDVCGRIGAQEKDKCDAHLAALRQLEVRLSGGTSTTECSKPLAPIEGAGLAQRVEQQMDIISAAFTCDLTRVATLQLGFCDGGLDEIAGLNHHDITHATGDTKGAPEVLENHRLIDRWYADRWAYLLKQLSSVQEHDGSLLDNTLILFGSDTTTATTVGLGAHSHSRFPYWLAGGKNFAFPSGRYLRFNQPADANGSPEQSQRWQPASRLFVSILQRFGIERDTFGNMDPGSGKLDLL